MAVYTPHLLYITAKNSVCSVPVSLAVTNGISIDFFSCGYWDVSLPRVPYPYGFITKSHSVILGSKATCASPKHIVACHDLHRLLSLVIHLIAYFIFLTIINMHGLINMNMIKIFNNRFLVCNRNLGFLSMTNNIPSRVRGCFAILIVKLQLTSTFTLQKMNMI